jgi:hypothetical protein
MSTHGIIQRSLLAAFAMSITTLASAHNFPKPQTKADIAAERAAACKLAMTTGASTKRTFARFGPPTVVTTGASYRVAGAHRFGGGSHVDAVSCTRPARGTVACR